MVYETGLVSDVACLGCRPGASLEPSDATRGTRHPSHPYPRTSGGMVRSYSVPNPLHHLQLLTSGGMVLSYSVPGSLQAARYPNEISCKIFCRYTYKIVGAIQNLVHHKIW
jgi:hypothetical protein